MGVADFRPKGVMVAIDPGAERAGIAVFDEDGTFVRTYHISVPRNEALTYQEYRLELSCRWAEYMEKIIDHYKPSVVVNEILPPAGFNNMTQAYLVNVMLTAVHVICHQKGIPVHQVSAKSVQAAIAKRKKSTNITTTQVRDGVLEFIPELADRAKKWTKDKIWEESDACAIGLYVLGYRNKSWKAKRGNVSKRNTTIRDYQGPISKLSDFRKPPRD